MKTVIIAEAGVNHNGEISLALKLIEKAAEAGADYIKFQTFITEKAISRDSPLAEYQKKTSAECIHSQYDLVKKMELGRDEHIRLIEHCKKNNIKFLSSPFDLDSLKLLYDLGLDTLKIASGEITNLPFLRAIGKLNRKIIMSTGMSTLEEINAAINVMIKQGLSKRAITLLHCTTEYPCPFEDVNLKAIFTLKDQFGMPVGYSDHTLGYEVAVAAITMGAGIIEKHFTLDKNLPGPDQKSSLDPNELTAMITAIRNIEKAIGDGVKKPSPSEVKNIIPARKSIYLYKSIRKREIIDESYLITLRPGDGISPMKWDSIIGKKAKRDLPEGHKLEYTDFE